MITELKNKSSHPPKLYGNYGSNRNCVISHSLPRKSAHQPSVIDGEDEDEEWQVTIGQPLRPHANPQSPRHNTQRLLLPSSQVNHPPTTAMMNDEPHDMQATFRTGSFANPYYAQASSTPHHPAYYQPIPMHMQSAAPQRKRTDIGPERNAHYAAIQSIDLGVAFINRHEYYKFLRILDLPHLRWESHGTSDTLLVVFRTDGTAALHYYAPRCDSDQELAQPYGYAPKGISGSCYCALRYVEPLRPFMGYRTVFEVRPTDVRLTHLHTTRAEKAAYVVVNSTLEGEVYDDRFATEDEIPIRYQKQRTLRAAL